MGKEFHDKGANVQFGPGVNIARLSNAGRSFEYLSGEVHGLASLPAWLAAWPAVHLPNIVLSLMLLPACCCLPWPAAGCPAR
jgi:hypothetical protein